MCEFPLRHNHALEPSTPSSHLIDTDRMHRSHSRKALTRRVHPCLYLVARMPCGCTVFHHLYISFYGISVVHIDNHSTRLLKIRWCLPHTLLFEFMFQCRPENCFEDWIYGCSTNPRRRVYAYSLYGLPCRRSTNEI